MSSWAVIRCDNPDSKQPLWRTVFEGTEDVARREFRAHLEQICQGELRLLAPDGKMVALHRIS